jgi:hypothetical protein
VAAPLEDPDPLPAEDELLPPVDDPDEPPLDEPTPPPSMSPPEEPEPLLEDAGAASFVDPPGGGEPPRVSTLPEHPALATKHVAKTPMQCRRNMRASLRGIQMSLQRVVARHEVDLGGARAILGFMR